MKKLIFVLAVSVMVCGAAFADVTMTDWEPLVYGSTLSITDYEPAGFDVELSEWENAAHLDVETYNVSGWLYDPNAPITVTISGFDNDAFIASDNTWLMLDVMNWDEDRYADYELPFTGNGTYTFTSDNMPYYDEDYPLDGIEVTYADIYIYDRDARDTAQIIPGASGRVTFTVGTPEEEETVVPEPATYAYALMGLGSLAGIKRRIRK
ncbi:MAG: PEP-CTERM sorting domain-containing protein [Abditibacteriota bacterium]|nr:PEP-CTERM sorting domain-containing protein [Abditibacteriota bacterium]